MVDFGSSTHYVPGMNAEQARRARQLEIPVLVATLLTIPVLVLVSLDLDDGWKTFTVGLNWAVWLMFLFEAIVMFRICPDDSAYIRNNPVDILVLVLTPPFLPEALHFLWVLRLLRILDLLPLIGRIFRFGQFRYAATLSFLAVFGGGIAYAEIEEGRGVDEFDGVWWAMTTISTVGYGDQFPTSPGGRVLGMAMMVVGPVLIGLVASGVGSVVTTQIREEIAGARGVTQRELDELEEAVEDVEVDVEGLSETDKMILARLSQISRRLDDLEKR